MREAIRVRRATKKDAPIIDRIIVEWLNWRIPREESIRRGIENEEILVAEREGEMIGFIHYAMHEDIIDGGLNSFITCLYVALGFRNKGIGSKLLERAIKDALDKRAVGIETSTASPDAKRFYKKHHFGQFMGKWTMGEVFLELNMEKCGHNKKASSTL